MPATGSYSSGNSLGNSWDRMAFSKGFRDPTLQES